jgi:hypothetical protein
MDLTPPIGGAALLKYGGAFAHVTDCEAQWLSLKHTSGHSEKRYKKYRVARHVFQPLPM